uniref:Zona pellucida sperm-binding protein 3 n=1 Tax=Oreochromis niloticus TaxID=8128 RepID=A0A669DW02_ORENI
PSLRTGKHDSAAESSGQLHSGQGQKSALQSHLLHMCACFKQMEHSKHMPDKMITIFFCLVCGALAAAQESNEILHPEPTKDEPHFPPNFELRTTVAPDSIKVICGDNSIRVEAKRDLLGIGVLVQTADVTLGGCAATEEDPKAQILIFESELHGCGSQLLMSEEAFIYVFTLLYTPSPLGAVPSVTTGGELGFVLCFRKNDVSSDVLKPTWAPFSPPSPFFFFLVLYLSDDWQFPRSSTQFFLGDMIKFEASVEQFHHVPLRVTVDSCVATVVPNVDTVPRYAFLGNNGCMFDGQLTGSSSRFLPQFQHGNSDVVRYATAFLPDRCRFHIIAQKCRFCFFVYVSSDIHYCSLKATEAAANVNATKKPVHSPVGKTLAVLLQNSRPQISSSAA